MLQEVQQQPERNVYIACIPQMNEETPPHTHKRFTKLRNINVEPDPLVSAMRFHRTSSTLSPFALLSHSSTRRTTFLKGPSTSSNIFHPLPQDIYRKKFKLNRITQPVLPTRNADLEINKVTVSSQAILSKQIKNETNNCSCSLCASQQGPLAAKTMDSVQNPTTKANFDSIYSDQDYVIVNHTISVGIDSAGEEVEEKTYMIRTTGLVSSEQKSEVNGVDSIQNGHSFQTNDSISSGISGRNGYPFQKSDSVGNSFPFRNDDSVQIGDSVASGSPIRNGNPISSSISGRNGYPFQKGDSVRNGTPISNYGSVQMGDSVASGSPIRNGNPISGRNGYPFQKSDSVGNGGPIRNDDSVAGDGLIRNGNPTSSGISGRNGDLNRNDDSVGDGDSIRYGDSIENEDSDQISTLKDKYAVDPISNWFSLFVLLSDRGFAEEVTYDILKTVQREVDRSQESVYSRTYKHKKIK
ncbi:uncharacterized threonine-rich GPI-anchored glycoprotein PJ4664.02 isoform X3 [Agrilus planipennis]|uniref:Uncharacterized threonine-rich GPI-anchored glycoprotein PJ4664.02 isoform X3 n=1 Tax=Agrilus planipennis TaxID=224129 RepID=A0A1W4WTR8_AGRPL|nr:uncharacterized threonine-rich GPI-anchored glycoprotein PJ4664.02 isoform X3 [Agrilus planipennis]